MRNRQTCTIGDLNVILAVVALMDVQTCHVVGEMVGGTGVHEPWLIIMRGVGGVAGPLIFGLVDLIEAVATI